MKVHLSQHIDNLIVRKSLSLLLLVASVVSLPTVVAEDHNCGGEISACEEYWSTCDYDFYYDYYYTQTLADHNDYEYEEELCGWATHDSCPLTRPSEEASPAPQAPVIAEVKPSQPVAAEQESTELGFDETIAAAASAACAHAGVCVEQIIEPFAMVGPQVVGSFTNVKAFQDWWADAIQPAEQLLVESQAAVPPSEVEVQTALEALAFEEPLDVTGTGPSVLVDDEFDSVTIPDPTVSQIGSSGIIITIEEEYLSYDLAEQDLQVWSVFPINTQPFCIRGASHAQPAIPSLWDEIDAALGTEEIAKRPAAVSPPTSDESDVESEQVAEESSIIVLGSAECLLDDLVWRTSIWLDDNQHVVRWLSIDTYGAQLAGVIVDGNRLAEHTIGQLASVWPAALPQPRPQTAGELLMARAGAVEAAEPVAIEPAAAPVEIAELPTETNVR